MPAIRTAVRTPTPGATGFPWRAGSWYAVHGGRVAQNGILRRVVLAPMWVPAPAVADRCAIEVTTAQTGATFQPAVYADVDGWPSGAPLWAGPAFDCSTAGVKEAPATVSLPAGWTWIGGLALGTTVPNFRALNTIGVVPVVGSGPASTVVANTPQIAQTNVDVAALPDPWSSPYGSIAGWSCPIVALRGA